MIDFSVIWFAIIVFAVLMYIVMNGFDSGASACCFLLTKTQASAT